MNSKTLALSAAGSAPSTQGDGARRSGLALAGATLLLVASAAALLAARGNPYDGAPVVRVHVTLPAGGLPPLADKPKATPVVGGALAPAPVAGLTAPGPGGLLPIVAPDGRASWKAYARPFVDDGRPKIALVIGGLGLDADQTRKAIGALPPEITLSFSPYADGLQALIDQARAAGHEVMIEAPMEPLDYPDTDPGPHTLLSNASPIDISHRLDWLMSRATGYFAMTNTLGARFIGQPAGMATFLQALRQRGVAFIDDGQASSLGGGLHRASMGARIDADLDGAAIDNQLLNLEAQSLQTGGAIGAGSAYPMTVAQVQRWAVAVRDRGYALAPASALMTLRP
jgi:polysaccharide deacetylase 2 family uncharacterized protein YibQ